MVNKIVKMGIILLAIAILLLSAIVVIAGTEDPWDEAKVASGDPWDDEESYNTDGDPWQDEDPWDENKYYPLDVIFATNNKDNFAEHPWDDDECPADPWDD